MKPIKGRRATWRTCWHWAAGVLGGLGLMTLSTLMVIAGIWSDDRWAGTGAIVGVLAIVVMGTVSVVHCNTPCKNRPEEIEVRLPWRKAVEDE